MRFAICNEMFEGWDFTDVCNAAADSGYTGIEIAPFTLGKPIREFTLAERVDMIKTAERSGVEIIGLHWILAQTTGFHINSPAKDIRDRTVQYLIDLVHLSADFGGGVMVFGSPKQRDVADGLSYQQAWDYALETFRAVVPELERYKVTLCLEPLAPAETNFLNSADEASRMIREIDSPNLQLLLDIKAMSAESKPIPDIIRDNRFILKHFHANDANLRGPGFGDTDFVPIAGALKEIDYTGWVSVEVFDFSPDPVTIATKSMECLKCAFG